MLFRSLREKCPWDKKQTNESLRSLTIEETYELADAILNNDASAKREELGDLMLHLVFYAKIGEENNEYDIADIINTLCDKMERRHPHIYGDMVLTDADAVIRNWEQMKLKEGKKSALAGVPTALPALVKAMRIQAKAQKIGFDWDTPEQVWEKVLEETNELAEAAAQNQTKNMQEELGDLLFAIVNYARFINIDPEEALERTNKKFTNRFVKMEAMAAQKGLRLADMTLAEMDLLWEAAKKTEKENGQQLFYPD